MMMLFRINALSRGAIGANGLCVVEIVFFTRAEKVFLIGNSDEKFAWL